MPGPPMGTNPNLLGASMPMSSSMPMQPPPNPMASAPSMAMGQSMPGAWPGMSGPSLGASFAMPDPTSMQMGSMQMGQSAPFQSAQSLPPVVEPHATWGTPAPMA